MTCISRQDHDGYGALANLRYRSGASVLLQQSVQRDALGRIEQLNDVAVDSSRTWEYSYDIAGRLERVWRNGLLVQQIWYDANGNADAVQGPGGLGDTTTTEIDAQDRLTNYGDTAYEWTANGELARRIAPGPDTTRTTYDALGNLTGAHLPGVAGDSLTYLIDASNRRVARFLDGQRTHTWLYTNHLNLVAELDGDGTLRHRYAYATQAHVPDLLVHADTVYRLITDHLGSVRAAVRVSDGEVAQRVDYDGWGVRTLETNPDWQGLGFVGGLTDTSTGLVRLGARDYEPTTGRWMTKDPIGFAGGSLGLYTYCNNRPTTALDPSGLTSDDGLPLEPDEFPFGDGIGSLDAYDRKRIYKHTIGAGRVVVVCGEVEDWVGEDSQNTGIRGAKGLCRDVRRPTWTDDVDAIKVCGRWYRIKGGVAIVACCHVIHIGLHAPWDYEPDPPTESEKKWWNEKWPGVMR